jgi:uncharacterized hydrophobic protein (TIGR00271 family)
MCILFWMTYLEKKGESVFWASLFEQKKSLKKLIEESHAGSSFYLFLSVSAFITTLGLLLDSAVVVIGGMLVAPLLIPILSLSMGITTANKDSILRSLNIIFRSVVLVLVISIATTFLFGGDVLTQNILINIQPDLIFFFVALAAGLAAAYAWVKQNLSATLPGIAVSVALIPPLSAVGVGIVYAEGVLVSGALTLFLINLLGITMSALIIFSLFGFARLAREEEKLIKEEVVEDLSKVKNKLEATKEKLKHVTEQIEEVAQTEGQKK